MSAIPADVFEPEPDSNHGADSGRWIIDSAGRADWAVRKIAEATSEIETKKALAQREVERIQQWATDETRAPGNTVEHFTRLLEEYHRKCFAQDPALKTISLPGGKLKLRRSRTAIDVTDADAFLEWASQYRKAWIREKREPAKLEILKGISSSIPDIDNVPPKLPAYDPETGELIPGIALSTGEETFSVEVAT